MPVVQLDRSARDVDIDWVGLDDMHAMDAAIGHVARVTGWPLAAILPLAISQPAALIGIEPAGTVEADWDAETGVFAIRSVDD